MTTTLFSMAEGQKAADMEGWAKSKECRVWKPRLLNSVFPCHVQCGMVIFLVPLISLLIFKGNFLYFNMDIKNVFVANKYLLKENE